MQDCMTIGIVVSYGWGISSFTCLESAKVCVCVCTYTYNVFIMTSGGVGSRGLLRLSKAMFRSYFCKTRFTALFDMKGNF